MTDFKTILELIFLSTFWCVALSMTSEKGDAFYFLRWLVNGAPQWIYKPVIGCINCMASVHTIIVMVLYYNLSDNVHGFPVEAWWKYFLEWLLVAVITSGLNGIVYKLYEYLESYVNYIKNL